METLLSIEEQGRLHGAIMSTISDATQIMVRDTWPLNRTIARQKLREISEQAAESISSDCLRLASLKPIVLRPTTGEVTIAWKNDGDLNAPKSKPSLQETVLKGGFDQEFLNANIFRTSAPTPEMHAEIWEQVDRATFEEMFHFFSPAPAQLCLTQHQIVDFLHYYGGHVSPHAVGQTFLPFLGGPVAEEAVFIACVRSTEFGPAVRLRRFWDDFPWGGNFKNRMVTLVQD